MARTYSSPESRARTRRPATAPAAAIELALLAGAGLLVAAFTWSAIASKAPAMAATMARDTSGAVLNLNAATSSEAIAAVLDVFPGERERRFVAREILDRVSGSGTGPTAGRALPNVGALARLTVESRRVQNTAGLTTLQGRLREARERAGGVPPQAITLLTSAQLADLKPRLIVRGDTQVTRALVWYVTLVFGVFLLVHLVRRFRRASGDPLMLPALFALSGIGLALMVSLRDPLRDVLLFVPFAQGVALGALLMLAVSLIDLERSVLPRLSYVPLTAALAISALLVTIGSGPTGSGARVNLFGVQPVDAIRVLVTLFLAGYFARRWEVLRELQDRGQPFRSWWRAMRPPRREDLVPVAGGVAVVLVAFFLQKDLGPALMVACVFLAMYGVARGRWVIATGGLVVLCVGFVAGYLLRISSTLVTRIQIWRSPWDNGAHGGDQVAQALWALASGGWWGTGLGLGMPEIVPAAHTDLILAAAGEQLGFAGLLGIAVLYLVIAARGLRAARRAAGEYSTLLAVGLTAGLVLPVLLIGGGLLGLIPLTGVVTPFLSYGRSALIVSFVVVGLLLSIADRGIVPQSPSPFAPGITKLGLAFAVCGLILLAVAGRTQTLSRDEVMVAGALTRQADDQRRFTYNPRLLEAAATIVRGSILDRRGLPLATSRTEVLAASAAALAGLGLAPETGCADARQRCYPFGGPLFHVVGDVVTRTNWAAPNTSFVERDRDVRLRGYDDQSRSVDIVDPETGARGRAVRRNLRPLLPLWTHRRTPDHPEIQALLDQPRDVRLTIDARLQMRVAALLRDRVVATRARKGAAVVVDAASGDLLAAVSYPWPDGTGAATPSTQPSAEDLADRLLDRARYGVYPPGSTFKLVTATAVLRSAPALAEERLVCRRLEDGRVGNVVSGWRRPVRDDVSDRVPHGELALDRGIVQSCNAYFAQLGVRLGGTRLREAAALFDIPLTRDTAPERLRDTLPFAAYGQGEVLATPFRMARVAAAIAAGGVMPPARLVAEGGPAENAAPVRVLDVASARRLGRAMREVVVSGTARGLMAHPEMVAGKTGTAEVDGAASHSWFVGFAPYGEEPAPRIAFAVIVENGGYGGRAAAPLAGEIVSAARELGLLGASSGAPKP